MAALGSTERWTRALAEAGLVESVRAGREIRYRAVGSRLGALAAELEAIGRRWDRRLAMISASPRPPTSGIPVERVCLLGLPGIV